MAFTRTNTPPNTNAKITVVFSGLMLLRQGPNDTCEIGIHRFDPGHSFEANLIVKKANLPPRLIRLQTRPPTSNFEMTVVPTPPGIQAFAATADPFDRSNQNNHPLDYRWSFNFRKLLQHDTVDFNEGARPVATLNTGVLYTPTLSRQGLNIQQICPNPNPPPTETATPLYRVAAELAFAIELTGNSKMVIGWSDFGRPQTQLLPRPGEENETDTTYTISLLNQPPFSDPPAHDELKLYYDVLRRNGQPIPNLEQCRLEIGDAQKNDQIPCLSVLLE